MEQFQAGQGDAGKHLRAEFLVQRLTDFQTSAGGRELLLPSLSGKLRQLLGCPVRSGGWAASGKIPL